MKELAIVAPCKTRPVINWELASILNYFSIEFPYEGAFKRT